MVGVALIVGAVLFAAILRFALVEQLQVTVETEAEEYADRIEGAGVPVDLAEIEDGFLQFLSPDGVVLSATEEAQDVGPILPPAGAETWTMRLPDDDTEYLVTAEENASVLVVSGRSLETVTDTLETVGQLLTVAVPLLIAVVAFTTWFVVGRALRPVDRMRRQVDEVTSTSLDRRVADPGGSDEIARLAMTMNSMLDRLEHAQRSQRQFLSDASHELKSPLASLRQYAEVATLHPDRISGAELSEAILDEGGRLERLVQGMLVLARADESSLQTTVQTVDLDDLVIREARRLRESTALRVDISAVGPARVRGDAGLLGQVVRNLVDNAARHATSHVAFSLTDEVLLAVDDDGAGIAPADREKVFERFVRLDEARARDSGGSGLGLAIVRELVNAHGGSVRATGSAWGGARIEVRLPALHDS